MDDKTLAMSVAEKAADMGGICYYVGGYVRDRLMGRETSDIDIEVHGIEPDVLLGILGSFGKAYSKGESFGIFGIKGSGIDFALPRKEKATGTGHRDFAVFTDPYIGPLKASERRDFTVNSLYENVITGDILDFWGGRNDIKEHVLRHVSDSSFPEDPLRVLRAAQFGARLGFTVADETAELCRGIDTSSLSRERVMEEMKKALLEAEKPSLFFDILSDISDLSVWFPEIENLRHTEQDKYFHPEGNAYIHTMMVLDIAAGRKSLAKDPLAFMLSALCHDMGKTVTTAEKDGRIHSYGHESEGVPIAREFLSRLTDDRRISKYVSNMVLLHMDPNRCAASLSKPKVTNRMFDRSVDPEGLIELAACDALVSADPVRYSVKYDFLHDCLREYRDTMAKPFVTGQDLIDAGLSPGTDFSEALSYAHKLRLAGIEKESALKQTLSHMKNRT